MKAKTGERSGCDLKGGISESGTIAPESAADAVAMPAKRCTGHVRPSRPEEADPGSGAGRKVTVELSAAVLDLVTAEADRAGVSVGQFLADAVAGMFEPVSAKMMASITDHLAGLLAADEPFTEWEILLDNGGKAFRVHEVLNQTVRAYPWSNDLDAAPASPVTFTHDQARGMRRAAIPKSLSTGDVLVWGDKACRVTRLPSAEEMANATRENPPMMTVAGDWLEADELFEEEVPYSRGALHVRFMRFALPAEREAFELADKIRAGRASAESERETTGDHGKRNQSTDDGR